MRERDRETAGERRAIRREIASATAEVARKAEAIVDKYQKQIKRQRDAISRLTDELLLVRRTCSCGAAERARVSGGGHDPADIREVHRGTD